MDAWFDEVVIDVMKDQAVEVVGSKLDITILVLLEPIENEEYNAIDDDGNTVDDSIMSSSWLQIPVDVGPEQNGALSPCIVK